MPALRNTIVVCLLVAGGTAGCAAEEVTTEPVASTTAAPDATSSVVPIPSRLLRPLNRPPQRRERVCYVYPFTGRKTSYSRRHHDYPATDVFGCGANVVAPTGGIVEQTRTVDPWDPEDDDPATRGGKYVSMLGDDGVRFYFAHLESVDVEPGDAVDPGSRLGIVGQTGNAKKSACHTHFGISWPCDETEWAVRRGEIWPWKYLDAWRAGEQLSPVDEIETAEAADPDACDLAAMENSAADA